MAHVFPYRKKNGSVIFKAQYTDHLGRRRTTTGTDSEEYTRKKAERLELQAEEIREGLRPPPRTFDTTYEFQTVVEEYTAQGCANGGRKGFGWGREHGAARVRLLNRWGRELSLRILSDLVGILPRVEKVLHRMQRAGRAGKTIANYAEALKAFCIWCVDRGYIEEDPLRHLKRFDTTPRVRRRCLTTLEIHALLEHCRPENRLIYEVALASGLRRRELNSLRASHLDASRVGLILEAAWTKNRTAGFQPLPKPIFDKLAALAKDRPLNQPLLQVPLASSQMIRVDLKRAGVPWDIPGEGKVDFHALRVAYISFVWEAGASVKEAQALARHLTPNLTLNTYGRTREEKLSQVAETVGKAMFSGLPSIKEALKAELPKPTKTVTHSKKSSSKSEPMASLSGFEPELPE